MQIMNRTHLDILCLDDVRTPFDEQDVFNKDLSTWIEKTVQKKVHLCFFWPSPIRSVSRFYAFAVDLEGLKICAYLKIAMSEMECEMLSREVNANRRMQEVTCSCFAIPQCLACRRFGLNRSVAIFEPLPSDATSIKFDENSWNSEVLNAKNCFAGDLVRLPPSELHNERWYNIIMSQLAPSTDFARQVLRSFSYGVDVCRTHGDFACHNFRRARKKLWIIDWEEYTEKGPCFADEICFFLCVRRFHLKWRLRKVFSAFSRCYLEGDEVRRRRAVQALAFLYGLRISLGKEIVDHWNRIA